MAGTIDDGGPAFPIPGQRLTEEEASRKIVTGGMPGMSLRAYVAASAMNAFIRAGYEFVDGDGNVIDRGSRSYPGAIAKASLGTADALIAALKQPPV